MTLFALAKRLLAAAFAMALGTAITVAALAVLTLTSKRLALGLAGAEAHWVEGLYRGFGFLGAGLLLLLGAGLFGISVSPSGPF